VSGHIEEFRPDLVLFGAPHPLAAMGPALRAGSGVPYAVLCHGAEITIPAAFPITRRLVGYALKRADLVFAVSHFTAGRVERLAKRPVHYLGAGVAVTEFTPAEAPAEHPVVGCVSRFVPRKGQGRVIEAAAALRAEGTAAEVLLVGKGRDERRLRRLASRLGVPVRFEVDVPWRDLPGLYRRMAVFVMPCRSRWFGLEVEGLGLVFLEAAASGLPVLAGDSGGSPETVDPGVTGFVVSRDEHIVEGLRMLLEDPARAAVMGAAGRERVLEEFTWEAVSARFSEAVRELEDGRTPGHRS
jgi:phosphatidylinositol alpha-1,6-mannosyltransferase